MSATTIVAQNTPTASTSIVRYHQIGAICFHVGDLLHIANGVVEVDGTGYLGCVQADADDLDSFTVAAFVTGNQHYFTAPAGWEADVTATAPTAVELAVAA